MKKLTINITKGAKMRKYIVPILLAGAVIFTAAQAMATDNSHEGSFVEDHFKGDHYKHTDALENGAHGGGIGGYQISSAWLKDLKSFVVDGDESYGYTTGNPFGTGGYAGTGSPGGETDMPLIAPNYTMPCPEWVAPTGKGSCDANTFATDPGTEDPNGTWDGVVLDDLYQVVASDDSGTQTSTLTNLIEGTRFLNQTFDALFYNGKRGIISIGTTIVAGTEDGVIDASPYNGQQRHFNIDQTLDQDLADYFVEHEGTTTDSNVGEISGIFGKLTQLFQLAGPASTINSGYTSGNNEGCASGGGNEESDSLVSICPSTKDGAEWAEDAAAAGDVLSTFLIDQWVVSDLADIHVNEATEKAIGNGVDQRYRSWFRDGEPLDLNYTYVYPAGHGTINKSVSEIVHPFDP